MKDIDKNKPVMVTGATGYVAGWLVKKLLEEGHTVHAPVREPDNKEKLKYLNNLAENSIGKIVFFKANLLEKGSYEESMQGCELVFHTASPFINKVKNPQRDLVNPALKGTRNVLESVNKVASVKRVVLTSSCAAIIGDSIDCLAYPEGIATEENWNSTSTIKHQPYSYSKTVAEQEAWTINKEQERWDLVVINPSLVLGPGINPNGTSESFNIIKQIGDGSMKSGAPEFYIGAVDVRDLAIAHYMAGFTPGARGRYIISAENTSLLQVSKYLQNKFGDEYPFPEKKIPKFMVWLMAPLAGFKRKMIKRNVGFEWKVNNQKGRRELAMQYTPIEKSVVDMFQQMIDNGYFKK